MNEYLIIGGIMSLALLLYLTKVRRLKTVTYTTGGTRSFKVPKGVSKIKSIIGKGGPGQPADSGIVYQHDKYYTVTNERADGTIVVLNEVYQGSYSGSPPPDYCDPKAYFPAGFANKWTQTCYRHEDTSYEDDIPATTGASTTAFNKTFPGGVGGPASSRSFTDVPVVPEQTYSLVVASGGSLTFTYYE